MWAVICCGGGDNLYGLLYVVWAVIFCVGDDMMYVLCGQRYVVCVVICCVRCAMMCGR